MDGDGPSQPQGELRKSAYLFLLYLMLFLVECISCIAPCLRLHLHGNSILGHYFQNIVFLIYVDDASQSAVDPPLLHIVFHEDDLCALLQFQMQECGERCFRKLPLDTPIKED